MESLGEKGKEEEYMHLCTYIRHMYILNSRYRGREIGCIPL